MKQYNVYKNIRKGAVIMGLPLSSFAIFMCIVILSLIVMIFSFSLVLLIVLLVVNFATFGIMTQLAENPSILNFSKVFPKQISNKRTNNINYEDDQP